MSSVCQWMMFACLFKKCKWRTCVHELDEKEEIWVMKHHFLSSKEKAGQIQFKCWVRPSAEWPFLRCKTWKIFPPYCTWNSVFRVDRAAGGEGDGGRVVLLVLLPPAVEQQQSQQQNHQDDEHDDAADRCPRLPLAGGERDHDAPRLLRRVWEVSKKKQLS